MEDAEDATRYPARETAVKHERIVKNASCLFREAARRRLRDRLTASGAPAQTPIRLQALERSVDA
jgi:hypothetical protein